MGAPRRDASTEGGLTKRQWRRSILAAIATLDRDERRDQEAALIAAFPGLPGWAEAGTVLLYVSAFAEEIRTARLLSMAYEAGKRVVLPRVDRSENRLRLHVVKDVESELEPGVLGILEPPSSLPEIAANAIDWALVPGVAFDERGYRLGRGAGHYDRLLPGMRPDAPCWALCLACQLVSALPVEPHDVALDGVRAPHRTVNGPGRSARAQGRRDDLATPRATRA